MPNYLMSNQFYYCIKDDDNIRITLKFTLVLIDSHPITAIEI
jgi:hypothetical protein